MAFGLFASLLIGTIFTTLGDKLDVPLFLEIAKYAKQATGAAIGVAIAYSLHAPSLVIFSAVTAGIAGNALGGPVGAYVATVVSTELGKKQLFEDIELFNIVEVYAHNMRFDSDRSLRFVGILFI